MNAEPPPVSTVKRMDKLSLQDTETDSDHPGQMCGLSYYCQYIFPVSTGLSQPAQPLQVMLGQLPQPRDSGEDVPVRSG